jgi:hypothetical protein
MQLWRLISKASAQIGQSGLLFLDSARIDLSNIGSTWLKSLVLIIGPITAAA